MAKTFRELALLHRGRTGLTQRGLAARMGVHVRSVQAWEGGISCPDAAHLRALLAAYLAAGGLAPGHELAQAQALWAAALRDAPRLRTPFDQAWFTGLLAAHTAEATADDAEKARPPDAAADTLVRRRDWGEAPEVVRFHGRAEELTRLTRWVREERCRVVALLGLGGIGKTMLAARLAHAVAPSFDRVYWRSLRNAPSPSEWLAGAIGFLSPHAVLPLGDAGRLTLLLERLREQRCLLVLDNLETVLQPGEHEGRYREGYAGYGMLLQHIAETEHRSCLLLTSREAPDELGFLAGEQASVRAAEVGGLGVDDGRALLHDKHLSGEETAWAALVARYGGNPLALQMVGESIRQVFAGSVLTFLHEGGTFFGGIRRLLEAQLARSSPLERALLRCLAVAREPITFAEIAADLGPANARGAGLEAAQALRRRSLLESGERHGTITLQPVVLEYVTEHMIEAAHQEIVSEQADLLVSQALLQATAKDYVRRSQERLILAPLIGRLVATTGSPEAAAQRLRRLLDVWRGQPTAAQGCGPGNVVNLLRLLQGHLRAVDLSGLAIRHAFLQDVEAQDASLAASDLSGAVLADAFSYPTCVALSADGAYVAAGTTTGEVCLWRAADRALVATLSGHEGLIVSVALSRDGRVAASGSEDGTVRVWDTSSGLVVATLDGRPGEVRRVALSSDGTLVASGSHDGTVHLWESASGRPLATLPGYTSGVRGVALSGDGALVASASVDGAIRLWDARGGRPLAPLAGHERPIWGVALSADGRFVASGSVDETVRLWDAASGERLAELRGHTGAVWSVALNADGHRVASASFDGTVKLWEAPGGRALATLVGHSAGVRDVALSGGGELVASCSFDGTVCLWEAEHARLLATLRGHTSGARGVALSDDGRLVASGSYDGTVRLWDVESGRLLRQLSGHTSGVWSVALSDDGELVASGSFDGTVRLWETGSGRLLRTLPADINEVWGVALSGDGQIVASGSYSGTMRLWEAPTGRPLARLEGHTGGVWGVSLSGSQHVAASGGEDGTVKLWDADSGRTLATLRGHTGSVWNVALSGDARRVASGGEDGTVCVWEVWDASEASEGRRLSALPGHTGGVWSVALSRGGDLVASGSFDGLVRLWEAETGRLLTVLRGHTGGVWNVALGGNGRLVASGGFDGTLRLWDATTGACLRTLRADRRYERTDITGLTGITDAQRGALLALGAVEVEVNRG